MDMGGFILLEEMILVHWSLSFIDEEGTSSDAIECAALVQTQCFFFSVPLVGDPH